MGFDITSAAMLGWSSYFGGLLVSQDLWVDSVELQDEFIHQFCIETLIQFQKPAVYSQLFKKALCHLHKSHKVSEKTAKFTFFG